MNDVILVFHVLSLILSHFLLFGSITLGRAEKLGDKKKCVCISATLNTIVGKQEALIQIDYKWSTLDGV